jgi:hypothetical protein
MLGWRVFVRALLHGFSCDGMALMTGPWIDSAAGAYSWPAMSAINQLRRRVRAEQSFPRFYRFACRDRLASRRRGSVGFTKLSLTASGSWRTGVGEPSGSPTATGQLCGPLSARCSRDNDRAGNVAFGSFATDAGGRTNPGMSALRRKRLRFVGEAKRCNVPLADVSKCSIPGSGGGYA